jgi:hypothetical protein
MPCGDSHFLGRGLEAAAGKCCTALEERYSRQGAAAIADLGLLYAKGNYDKATLQGQFRAERNIEFLSKPFTAEQLELPSAVWGSSHNVDFRTCGSGVCSGIAGGRCRQLCCCWRRLRADNLRKRAE